MAKRQSTLFSFLKTVGSSGQSSKPDFTEDTARSESTDVLPAENDTTDISAYAPYSVRRVLTDNQKYSLLTGSHGLSSNYQFPGRQDGSRGFQRRFQITWLNKFSWLVYSKQANGGFCLSCMLFGKGNDGMDLGVLVSKPLINFRKALDELKDHDSRPTHRAAVTMAEDFLGVMRGEQEPVNQQIDRALRERVAANRTRLLPIVKTIMLCARQNIPLRGHIDSSTQVKADPTSNHGNFWALLNFRVDAGDSDLAHHLATAPKNAQYISAKIQNQLIVVLGDLIRDKILANVKESQFFTILADEVTDCANMEQMSLVLRYVHPQTSVTTEDLVDFVECDDGVTGQAIARKITSKLQEYGLDLTLLRGQGYDGAGNMAGKTKGTAALITGLYPDALYLHCASHCLNLVIVKSCEITSVRNMMGVCKKVSDFFDSHPKRQKKLEDAIDDTQPSSTRRKVKDLSRTRWVQRLDALETLCLLHHSIVLCMEMIQDGGAHAWSADSLADARSLMLALTTTDFLSALVISHMTLSYMKGITRSLQAEAKDIVAAVREVNTVTDLLQSVRDDVDRHHGDWFREVEKMGRDVDVELTLPRRCGRQMHRANTPAETPSQYVKRVITIPLLDHLLVEMRSRFSKQQVVALQGLSLVPSILVTLSLPDNNIDKLVDLYKKDLPSPGSLSSELHSWQHKWQRHQGLHGPESLPTTPAMALQAASVMMFPNIMTLLTILCVLPVTTCTSERSHSSLKLIKSRLRSTMTNVRLIGLALMNIHRDIVVTPSEAINEFARRHPRKMELLHVMADS